MKKFIVLVFLIPFISFAKFYKALVTMNDGSTKKGFIELPDFPDNAKIKFRLAEKGDSEKLNINDVKSFEITNDENEKINFITIYGAQKGKGDKLKIDKNKSWARVIKEGKINLYRTHTTSTGGSVAASGMSVQGTGSSEGFEYFINRPGDNYAMNTNYIQLGGLSFCGSCFNLFKKTIFNIFENDCPKLVDLIEKEDIKKNGLVRLVELYEQNCGK